MGVQPKKKILIVDDDKDTQVFLKKRLAANGFDCLLASTVEAAIATVAQQKPDLVILDLMFRGPNGTAFLQKVKTSFWLNEKRLPILVISGLGEKEIVDHVMDIGACGFLRKPIDADRLLQMVNEYIL